MGIVWAVFRDERIVREEKVKSVRWALRAEMGERWAKCWR